LSLGIAKACPVVTRHAPGAPGPEILVFRHPLAGIQLVKGTIEPEELPEAAAIRELREESGLAGEIAANLGVSKAIVHGQTWHFFHCQVSLPPERWDFHTEDDGGQVFSFFWWPVGERLTTEWHQVFVRAFDFAVAAFQRRSQAPAQGRGSMGG